MADVKPILFSVDMVRALLAGRKTQTRRVVKDQDIPDEVYELIPGDMHPCPYGQPGDLLWVREAWSGCFDQGHIRVRDRHPDIVWYWADGNCPDGDWEKPRPSIHMPRWASRLTLRVTGIRVERVQDISQSDADAEGCPGFYSPMHPDAGVTDGQTPREEFAELWNSINAKRGFGWDANPWVWVIDFEVIQRNVDDVLREAA